MIKRLVENKNLPFWLLTISLIIILTLPKLIQDGMFLDGMLYTAVSHNMGNGIGTFWSPVFSPSYYNAGSPFFHEHPPLVFGLQSLLFRVLGDSMYVERFYTFLTICISAFIITRIWNAIFSKSEEFKSLSWLPLIFWITIPSTSWSYSNNMMENSMGAFVLASVLFVYKAVDSEKNGIGFLLLSGLFIFLATMSKGVPGFFPLAVPFLYWIVFRKKSFPKVVLQTLIILLVPAILYLILFRIPESKESLTFYVVKRLLGRINDSPSVTSRFHILFRLFSELLPQILFSILIILWLKLKKKHFPLKANYKPSLLFFLTGLAASAPIALTLVQSGFYLVPSFPYFALGFSVLLAPVVINFRESVISNPGKFRIYKISGIAIFIFALSFTLLQKGKTVRDRDILHDVHEIGNSIPSGSSLTVNTDIASTYVLECYFIRYYNISLFIDIPEDFLLVRKTMEKPDTVNFKKLNIDTRVYDIYAKK